MDLRFWRDLAILLFSLLVLFGAIFAFGQFLVVAIMHVVLSFSA